MRERQTTSGHHQSRESMLEDHSFDELAKGLAHDAISRGRMLRLVGGALVGVFVASIPGAGAWAKTGGGNNDAAHLCQDLPPGPERGKCISDAAHAKGLPICPAFGPTDCNVDCACPSDTTCAPYQGDQ